MCLLWRGEATELVVCVRCVSGAASRRAGQSGDHNPARTVSGPTTHSPPLTNVSFRLEPEACEPAGEAARRALHEPPAPWSDARRFPPPPGETAATAGRPAFVTRRPLFERDCHARGGAVRTGWRPMPKVLSVSRRGDPRAGASSLASQRRTAQRAGWRSV